MGCMKKKVIGIILTISIIATLTACGGATPTTEETVNAEPAAETTEEKEEGPCKDGHTWIDATCTEPKTCSVCGATEGEALGHDWLENTPNYQQPKTCSRCNETDGDPLEPEFEKKGLAVETEWDKEFLITQPCYSNYSMTTVGRHRFSNLRRTVSDNDLGLEAAEGYEWLIFDFICKYDDANAAAYGFSGVFNSGMDYYDTYNVGNSNLGDMFEPGETDLETVEHFTVNWYGEDYPECMLLWGEYTGPEWNTETLTCINEHTIYIRIPTGYDGIVISMLVPGSDAISKYDAGEMVVDCLDNTCVNFRVIPE